MSLWTLIALMAVVTYASRALYLFVPADRIPRWLADHLDLVPVAVLSAMIAPGVVGEGAATRVPAITGSATTLVLLGATRSPGWSVGGGVLVHVIAKAALGL